MKKLMVMATVAALAIASQAAGYKWTAAASGGIINDGTADTTLFATDPSATLYLFVCEVGTGDSTRSSVFNTLKGGGDISGAYTTTGLTTASKTNAKEWTDPAQVGKNFDMFFVTEEGDNFLISSLKEDLAYGGTTAKSVSWSDLTANTTSVLDATKGLATDGKSHWYAVPEPTSGLLLLLGVAGLALRRRRA